MNINWKARLTNKTWWVATISNLVLLLAYFNINLTDYIGKDWQSLIGIVFCLATQMGISVDTSTSGIGDKVVAQATETVVQASNTAETVQTTATTTAINNTVDVNSASAKITVDNPDNVQTIGNEVNTISAVAPQ